MRSLKFTCRPDANIVTFDDERDRRHSGGRPAVASVTIDTHGGDVSWGEFLSWEELLALHAWTGALIAAAVGDESP